MKKKEQLNSSRININWKKKTKLWDYRQKKSLGEFHDCDDYISDLVCAADRRTLLATRYEETNCDNENEFSMLFSGEGTLTVYNVRKKKLQIQSELMDSDLTACQIVKVKFESLSDLLLLS